MLRLHTESQPQRVVSATEPAYQQVTQAYLHEDADWLQAAIDVRTRHQT